MSKDNDLDKAVERADSLCAELNAVCMKHGCGYGPFTVLVGPVAASVGFVDVQLALFKESGEVKWAD